MYKADVTEEWTSVVKRAKVLRGQQSQVVNNVNTLCLSLALMKKYEEKVSPPPSSSSSSTISVLYGLTDKCLQMYTT